MRGNTVIRVGALVIAFVTSPLLGQSAADLSQGAEAELGAESGSFGLGNQDYWVSAWRFAPNTDIPWTGSSSGYFATTVTGDLAAQIDLPAGAQITAISCYFYDDDVTNMALVRLRKASFDQSSQTPSVTLLGPAITSMDTGGYHVTTQVYSETIRYQEGLFLRNFYFLYINAPASSDVRFRGCRIVWNRQVSPAPASATFADVPTNHPYFQFIEALSASGITAGCGGGLYCVNAPITRGEMAVFLAAALGLHFPN